ncbi:Cl-channel protein [Dacryopinax primogenitus]|uniref:Chloride channel protein n=1 Tax=Dacryopinax primogenitus (strain DJM 731) TaxID=1858805 RepID=M5GD85_DACPD|nr:Cl-channel protein [Dacryopinax primogenitus]EJU04342.1 Cl-channel protein [Dacryopinax primogenitus]
MAHHTRLNSYDSPVLRAAENGYPPENLVSHEDEEEELEQIRRYEDFRTIDWIHDSMLERNRRMRQKKAMRHPFRNPDGSFSWDWLRYQLRWAGRMGQDSFIVTAVGAVIGITSALISILTEWLSDLKMGYCSDGWWLNQQFCCWEIDNIEGGRCRAWRVWTPSSALSYLIYVIVAALFSFLAAHLVKSYAKYAAGSGISEIKCILSGFVIKGYLGIWTFVIKALTLPLVIASGLSVGKEGPSVHIAGCVGNIIARCFPSFRRSESKMREILTAASATGVAVAFGSPIGGVMFSIEEMSHIFTIKTMWKSFFCALVATVTLSFMNPYRTGKLVLFQVRYDRDWHFFEIFFFVIIGIFGGLYGAFVTKFNLQVAAFRRKHLASYPVAEAVILATVTAVFGYFNRFLRIDMNESLAILFKECSGGGDYENLCQTWAQWPMANSLFIATIFRIGFVIVSYGAKVPAGIFVPSMAIGATFGRMVGIIVKAMYQAYPTSGWFAACQPDAPCITPGTYALLGAAAALGGIMRLTVTVVVIMFELTGAATYILPLMIVLLVTRAVGDLCGASGIADEMIRFNGFPFLEKEEQSYDVTVSSVMHRELVTLSATMRLGDIKHILETTTVQGFPVLNSHSKVLRGYIGRTELLFVISKARRAGNPSPNTLCELATEEHIHETGQPELPLITPTPLDGHLGPMGIEEDEAAPEAIEDLSILPNERLNFKPWVNKTPLTVAPQLPLEIVMQLFKRMGPRVILVERYGSLVGLITIKDVLRYTAETEHAQSLSNRYDEWSSLDSTLVEAYSWWKDTQHDALDRMRQWARVVRRR